MVTYKIRRDNRIVVVEGGDDDPAAATLPNTFSKKSPSPSLDLAPPPWLVPTVVLVLPPYDMATLVSLLYNRRVHYHAILAFSK